jgi:hypothetical protein
VTHGRSFSAHEKFLDYQSASLVPPILALGLAFAECKCRRRFTMQDPKKQKEPVEVADTNLEPRDIPLNSPLPTTNDPGGASAKGYSADPKAETPVKAEGAIPLTAVADDASHVRQPERDGKVRPTGRSEPHDYTPNDRLMGSDR